MTHPGGGGGGEKKKEDWRIDRDRQRERETYRETGIEYTKR